MPNFDHITQQGRNIGSQGKYSYSKILAIYNPYGDPSGIPSKSARVNMAFKETSDFNNSLASLDTSTYFRTAGADISNILMPYETISNNISGMPSFGPTKGSNVWGGGQFGIPVNDSLPSGQAGFNEFLPMYWNRNASGTVADRWFAPSGDTLNSFVSSKQYYGDIDRFRDTFDMRGIGMRLPMVGVGWGYTSDGNRPFPSGTRKDSDGTDGYPSGTMFFKGGYTKGWMVDPSDYIAAPIAFKYDLKNNVWTCSNQITGTGLYKVYMLTDDKDPSYPTFDFCRFHE